MRAYNRETDRPIIDKAVSECNDDSEYGALTACKIALEAAGIRWPAAFNYSKGSEALQVDSDIVRAMGS